FERAGSNRRPAGFIPQASWRWNPSIRDDWVSARVLIRFAFFPCPIGPQLGTQFRSGGRTDFLLCCRRGWARAGFGSSQLRPSGFLARGNFSFHGAAHDPFLLCRRAEETAQFFVEHF